VPWIETPEKSRETRIFMLDIQELTAEEKYPLEKLLNF